jgi:patatin-like phospholipase/acyl hydrolase
MQPITEKKLVEAIDDSRQVGDLIAAAEKFIEKGRTYYTRDDQGPTVTESIKTFINSN